MTEIKKSFWTMPVEDVIKTFNTRENGLTNEEAQKRLEIVGSNSIRPKKRHNILGLFISQFKSPIILILFFAVGLSFFLNDNADAIIILVIALGSGLLGFWQEYGASNAVEKLLALVQIKATLLRNGLSTEVSVEEIVPGDIVMLEAGDIIPGDCLIIESNAFFIDEATLTGETFPLEKEPGLLPEQTGLAQRKNSLWMGTHVIS